MALIFVPDSAFQRVAQKFPSMAEFLCQVLDWHVSQPKAVRSALEALDSLLSRPFYRSRLG